MRVTAGSIRPNVRCTGQLQRKKRVLFAEGGEKGTWIVKGAGTSMEEPRHKLHVSAGLPVERGRAIRSSDRTAPATGSPRCAASTLPLHSAGAVTIARCTWPWQGRRFFAHTLYRKRSCRCASFCMLPFRAEQVVSISIASHGRTTVRRIPPSRKARLPDISEGIGLDLPPMPQRNTIFYGARPKGEEAACNHAATA